VPVPVPVRPWSVPVRSWPFGAVVDGRSSLGATARAHARHRVEDPALWADEPEESWEAPAIALEAEVWAALFPDSVDVIALARRAPRGPSAPVTIAAWECV
jgi:hypothetical protein